MRHLGIKLGMNLAGGIPRLPQRKMFSRNSVEISSPHSRRYRSLVRCQVAEPGSKSPRSSSRVRLPRGAREAEQWVSNEPKVAREDFQEESREYDRTVGYYFTFMSCCFGDLAAPTDVLLMHFLSSFFLSPKLI